ncbi:hypothetical protein HME9302_00019 [Alteripontixanthobacter maritimus]|uniref:Uncharacterized protein n=1 Tax=Alteripontixanthobacter maritimus TaxID=2161824 RepID=A0A369QC14_9SPHN|nr:hypothetical protein [Alteripontixanthobacter maritimus]RDC59798.1 hypothetical protein HME9302_00993 [Alteripontixanthobacter maritimus]RDC66568.1 hypothetical protein HME9302_00019 [Alteripontixanthobacter maritimus]
MMDPLWIAIAFAGAVTLLLLADAVFAVPFIRRIWRKWFDR